MIQIGVSKNGPNRTVKQRYFHPHSKNYLIYTLHVIIIYWNLETQDKYISNIYLVL